MSKESKAKKSKKANSKPEIKAAVCRDPVTHRKIHLPPGQGIYRPDA